MSAHQYLTSLLGAQNLSERDLQTLRDARDAIERWLRSDIGSAPRIYYGGSFAKGTMLREAHDLDIVVYFPSTETSTLQQLFARVHQRLIAGNLIVRPRTVALRLPYEGGFHIDVIPGRAQDSTFRFATLFKNTTPPGTLQTSLKVHIEAVKDAGLSQIVRLAKLWRFRHGLDVPTFVLEIAVARAMHGIRREDLSAAFWTVLGYLSTDFSNARLIDSANTNNVVELAAGVRQSVLRLAQYSRAQQNWSSIVW